VRCSHNTSLIGPAGGQLDARRRKSTDSPTLRRCQGWKLSQSPRLGKLWLTEKGNAALAGLGQVCPETLDLRAPFHFTRWCDKSGIDLVIVGPEAPLADGAADLLATTDRLVFGPSKEAARIEADKVFAKEIMRQGAVANAEARTFDRREAALEYVAAHDDPCVVKASGLAAGKGVFVCETQEEAVEAVDQIMAHRTFGEAGDRILIEEKLLGQEVSILALVDGRTIWVLDPAQDHKQVGEGDKGPNTGGMGAYCPAPVVDRPTLEVIEREIFVPTIDALRRDGIEYRGVLYAGLMLTAAGPKVLEFNCRFGDPECQPLMSRLQGDLVEICWATASGGLEAVSIDFDPRVACCVVMCAEGYPGPYAKGRVITGIEDAEALGNVRVFHAGTTRNEAGDLVTNGGRVLGVNALAADLQSARDLANAACDAIHFDGAFFRRDIGDRVLVQSPS
jgi:phosphoribosylamine--glycine ligase